jgi:plastocyanin
MRNRARGVLTLAGVLAMILAMTTNARAVEVVNRTADNLKGGDIRNILFTIPEDYPWIWRMTAVTADGWVHVPDTQSPDESPWVPTGFTGKSGYWTSIEIESSDTPERNFQQTFSGQIRPDAAGGGEPQQHSFTIEARAGEYFVEPTRSSVCVGNNITLTASDHNGNPVVSTWSISSTDDISPSDIFNGSYQSSSVTFSSTEPGEYTVTGTNAGNSEQTDSAKAFFLKVELDVPTDCKVPTVEGLVAQWPHTSIWTPFVGYQEPAVPDYITKDATSIHVNLLPYSAYEMDYSLKRIFPSQTQTIDDSPKSGGVFEYEINDSKWHANANWGPCASQIYIDNIGSYVQLPFYGTFHPNDLDHYIHHIPLLAQVVETENKINAGLQSVVGAVGLPPSVAPSLPFKIEDNLTEKFESFQASITRLHRVWLLDCCERAEKDHRRLEFSFSDQWDIVAEDNAMAAAIAERIYGIVIPDWWKPALDKQYFDIEGLTDGFNPANLLKDIIAGAISSVLSDSLQSNVSVDINNLTRQLEFCAEQGYPKSVAEWETLGSAGISGYAIATASIDFEDRVPVALDNFIADLVDDPNWGWSQIHVLPFHIAMDLQFQGGSFGPYQGVSPSVYLKNKRVTTANAGARTAFAIQPRGGGDLTLWSRKVTGWMPLITDELEHTGDFVMPYFVNEEDEVHIAVRDDDFNPCE